MIAIILPLSRSQSSFLSHHDHKHVNNVRNTSQRAIIPDLADPLFRHPRVIIEPEPQGVARAEGGQGATSAHSCSLNERAETSMISCPKQHLYAAGEVPRSGLLVRRTAPSLPIQH